jgi:hypothetical protein
MTEQQPTTEPTAKPTAHPAAEDGPIADTACQAVRDAAGKAGATAAEAWAHTTLYTRTGTDRDTNARASLLCLDDGDDPDGFPTSDDEAAVELAIKTAVSAAGASPAVPGDDLTAAYLDTHLRVRRTQITAHCRIALAEPAPAERDWSHLDQDRVRIGGIGVFAGDWAWYRDDAGRARIRTGFVGLLIDSWNGWAVFSCTRPVAEAIVADLGRMRAAMRADALAAGATDPDHEVDQSTPAMWFDGDTIVVDQRCVDDDPDAFDRLTARDDGTYVVMGWNWCWTVVEPGDCDAIVGYLPAPERQQVYELLTHAPGVRVPNNRLRVIAADLADWDTDVVVYHLDHDGQHAADMTADRRAGTRGLLPAGADAETAIHRFADGCRRFGQPMTVPEVIDALVHEYDFSRYAARADADDQALLRLLDDDWRIRDVITLPNPAKPRLPALREQLRRRSAVAGATRWELWTGRGWYPLGTAITPTPTPQQPTPAATDPSTTADS